MQGGVHVNGVLLIIAIVGTTVTPWQLFFQQSNVVDKRITPRWIPYERADTVIGAFVVVVGATAIMVTTAFAFHGSKLRGSSSSTRAPLLQDSHRTSTAAAGAIFAILLDRRFDHRSERRDALPRRTHLAIRSGSGIHCTVHGARRSPSTPRSRPWSSSPRRSCLSPHVPLGLITTCGSGARGRTAAECVSVSPAASAMTARCSAPG